MGYSTPILTQTLSHFKSFLLLQGLISRPSFQRQRLVVVVFSKSFLLYIKLLWSRYIYIYMYSFSLINWFSLLFLGFACLLFFYTNQSTSHQNMAGETPKSIYEFSVKDIQGNDVSLNDYAGKVLLIVNVASKCGLTHSNYKEMNVLYEKYKNQGFEILAFPCNQFAGQEPGSNEEIKDVVCTMFKAEFPVFDKVEVNGKNAAPLYKYLKSQKGGLFGDGIKWNFTKFLVDKNGKVVQRYAPTTSPMKIEKDIQNLLSVS